MYHIKWLIHVILTLPYPMQCYTCFTMYSCPFEHVSLYTAMYQHKIRTTTVFYCNETIKTGNQSGRFGGLHRFNETLE